MLSMCGVIIFNLSKLFSVHGVVTTLLCTWSVLVMGNMVYSLSHNFFGLTLLFICVVVVVFSLFSLCGQVFSFMLH